MQGLLSFNLMGLILDFVSVIFSLICIYRANHIYAMLIFSIWILVRKGISCKVKRNSWGIALFFTCGPEVLNFKISSYVQDMMINQNIFILSSGSEGNILDCNEDLNLNILLC